MPTRKNPLIVPKQHSRYGETGYFGEEEGLVIAVERKKKDRAILNPKTIQEHIAEMGDEQLSELGLQRLPSQAPHTQEPSEAAPEPVMEDHEFKPDRGGKNCLVCRFGEKKHQAKERKFEMHNKELVTFPSKE